MADIRLNNQNYYGVDTVTLPTVQGGTAEFGQGGGDGSISLNTYVNNDGKFGNSDFSTIDLTGVNTSNLTNMWGMFYGCESLTTLDLSGFDTSNVTNMTNMFGYCISLTSLDLSSFNTSNVTAIGLMFEGCESLQTLDIRNFDFTNVFISNSMFAGVPSTCVIYVNQSAYNFIANNYSMMQLADLSMLQIVSQGE